MTVPGTWSLDVLIEAFEQYQRRTRGLRDQTLHYYSSLARGLIREALGDNPIDLRHLGPSDVIRFVGASSRFSPRTMKTVGTALRSFFRFLRTQGTGDERLEAAIPAVAHWRLSTIPRCLNDEQLARVLASFEKSTRCVLRNRAIVFCLATLGLRPGEIAELRLEDIDWRKGTILLRTRKTRRGAILPLPHAAGRAIINYLRRERPKTGERRVFVQQRGARRGAPISRCVVADAVTRALRRAGVEAPLSGAYVLRHTVASRMVRHGVSLKEVGDLLGHRSLDTTTIYAKLDLPALHDVALPWPEVTS